MEESKPKPLTYDSLKSVLKYISFEKREEIHCHIPQLRKTNAIIPYQFAKVVFPFCEAAPFDLDGSRMSEFTVEFNDREWRFDEVRSDERSGTPEPNKCTLTRRGPDKCHAKPIILDKSPNDAYEELLNTFFRDGTTIKILALNNVSQHMQRQNPETYNWKVSKLKCGTLEGCFNKLLSYIDEKTLASMNFIFDENAAPILDVSLVKNCPKLEICLFEYRDSFPWDKLLLLKNIHFEISCSEFPREMFEALVENWKEPGRPIGSTFLLNIYGSVLNMKVERNELMDLLMKHHGAVPSKLPDNLSIDRCVTMKMTKDNDSELVVYTEETDFMLLSLTMKILHAGATIISDE